jgi:Mlc titration factor MtfA (ptsG expression regulator)
MNNYFKFLEGKARFSAWLIVLFITLLCIPLLLNSDHKVLAKIVGVSIVVLFSVALWYWRTQTLRKIKMQARIKLNLNDRFWLNEHIPYYKVLSKSNKTIFEDRLGLFLAEIRIKEIGKEMPEKETCLYVASSAIIAFWGLPYWNYGELTEVLVYPKDFNELNEMHNNGSGQRNIHHGGLIDSTMFLSLDSLVKGFKKLDGQNVGIHESLHLISKNDHFIDGVPGLFSIQDQKLWNELIETELIGLVKQGILDNYVYSGKTEFFAVIMKYYREKPEKIERHFPEIHAILKKNLPN